MESANGDQAGSSGASVDQRKLFVGGLSQETTEENVKEYFGKYGTIESINLKTDSNTGNSRGFCFIVFTAVSAVEAILAEPEHNINNKKIDVQRAKTKQGKLFVGGITSNMTEDDIKTHFAQFGVIVSAEFPFDKVKNERKKFCFVIFENEQAVKDIIKTKKQTIKNIQVDVKRAVTKDQEWGGGGGGGGGYGGGGYYGGPRGGGFGGRGAGRGGGRGGGGGWNQGGGGNMGYDQGGYGGGYGDGGWDQGGYGGGGGYAQGGGGYGNFNQNGGGGGGGPGYRGGFQNRPRGGNRGRGARQQPY